MEPLAPPTQVSLHLLPPGRPSGSTQLVLPVPRFAEVHAVVGASAMPDGDGDGDGDSGVVVVPEITKTTIASGFATFLNTLGTAGEWVGISAFLLLTLAFGVQVNVWFTGEEHYVLHMGAHRYLSRKLTKTYITRAAQYHAIGCEIRKKCWYISLFDTG